MAAGAAAAALTCKDYRSVCQSVFGVATTSTTTTTTTTGVEEKLRGKIEELQPMERPSQSEWLLPEIRGRSTMRYTKSSSISAGSAFVGVVRSSTHHTHTLTPNERYQVVSAVRKIHDTTPYMQQAANVWHWHYKHAYTCIERKTRRLIIKFIDALFLFSNILCALDREKSGSMCINKIACINSEMRESLVIG